MATLDLSRVLSGFIFILTAFFVFIISSVRFTLCGVGGALLLSGLVFLTCMDQDDARHNFGHSGGMVNRYVLNLYGYRRHYMDVILLDSI